MKYFLACYLFSLSLLQAAPVAQVEKLAEQCHILRNFERLLLKEGQDISARDLFVVEKGVAKIALKGGTLLIGSPSKLRIKNDASGFWLELLEGEVYFEVQDERSSWLIKTPLVQLRGNAVGFYLSLSSSDLELTVVKGELQWNNRWRDWSHALSNTQVVLAGQSVTPIQERPLTSLDREVYATWLSVDRKEREQLSDLNGDIYSPRREMLSLEQGRRARLLEVNRVLRLRNNEINVLSALRNQEAHRDLKEAIKEVDSFSFPTPLAPPPR
jgi:hypothetical protein